MPKVIKNHTCGTCAFYVSRTIDAATWPISLSNKPLDGECRRFPRSEFVMLTDWCGEWAVKAKHKLRDPLLFECAACGRIVDKRYNGFGSIDVEEDGKTTIQEACLDCVDKATSPFPSSPPAPADSVP